MQENRPFVPRILQRPFELFASGDNTKCPLCIRVMEPGILGGLAGARFRDHAGGNIEKRLRGIERKAFSNL